MMIEVTDNEARIIERLRALKQNAGHGTLRVEVTAGSETLIKREYSERLSARA